MTREAIREQGVIAIVRASTPERAKADVEALIDAGIRAVEVSLVTPDAIEVIRQVIPTAPHGVSVGVGTVTTAREVDAAASAGAGFIVSPILREDVVRATREAGMCSVPGVATPTEAMLAMSWQADFVKVFPASLWTPAVLREVLTALPSLPAVPTGGVTIASAPEWIRGGAVAVGIGGTLTRAGDPAAVAQQLLRAVASARRS